jgi:uncharacterized protein YkwD
MSPQHLSARLHVEALEDRHLLAGGIFYNPYTATVSIDGTVWADHARAVVEGNTVKVSLSNRTTTITRWYDPSDVRKVVFHGYEGNDTFRNDAKRNSEAYGGAGHDYLDGSTGYDLFFGGGGNDILDGNSAGDHLYGMSGDDRVYGGPGNDWAFGGAGSDTVRGSTGSNWLDATRHGVGAWINVTEEYFGSTSLSVFEREVINHTNREREAHGLKPLKISTKLTAAAQYHAHNMARKEHMAHVLSGVLYPDLVSRLRFAGYRYRSGGENLALNYEDAKSVVAAWMNSPAHRFNLLDPSFTEIGVGIRWSPSGQTYFCQVFGQPA